jgi:hypothetical protein
MKLLLVPSLFLPFGKNTQKITICNNHSKPAGLEIVGLPRRRSYRRGAGAKTVACSRATPAAHRIRRR